MIMLRHCLPVLLLTALPLFGVDPITLRLWPGAAPGETGTPPPERNQTRPGDREVAGRPAVRITDISDPTLTIFPADPANNSGIAMLVSPGGGYQYVVTDLEGSEVCAWLNSVGITGVLLKYRVPRRDGQSRHGPALQDAQRALGLIRQRAGEWGIHPQRIGALGFSAGGHLSAVLSNQHAARTYPAVDEADAVSCRPDFAVLLYPGAMVVPASGDALAPELTVDRHATPPTFIVMTQDDPVRVENALVYYQALHRAGVAAELHLYPTGGHGYGLRPTGDVVVTWPDRLLDWLRANRWLSAP